jgi:hypothetical protein
MLLGIAVLAFSENIRARKFPYIGRLSSFLNSRFEVVYKTAALTTNSNELNENTVVVYKNNNSIEINSGNVKMSQVEVFDIRGAKVISKSSVNNTQITLSNLTVQAQVLIVQIIDVNGNKVSKKIVY